ncbi:unnamed protein product [Brachionus calyciflorus]|uniref:Uncharacterized protein n=1 Tax=Brachionus calyciflorus TaxID=104777 RepID=A0A814B5M1_9BILA|nr:unnamed protein product [Brachionus calyciflorus]
MLFDFIYCLIIKHKFYLFLILVQLIRLNECRNSGLECLNSIDRSIRQQTFCFSNCYPVNSTRKLGLIRALIFESFDSMCKQPKISSSLGEQPSQYFSSKPTIYSESPNKPKIKVFVLDFYLVSGDIYIDFSRLNISLLKNNSIKSKLDTTLVLNLVTRQFMTFKIFNLPHEKSDYLTDIKILLNGESSLEILEKKGDLKIQVHHSPVYDYSTNRREWIDYLNTLLGDGQNDYVEYLSLFCHVSHIRLDINKMLLSIHDENYFSDYVEPLEAMPNLSESSNLVSDYYLGKNCTFLFNGAKYKKNNQEKNFLDNFQPHFFIEIEQNPNEIVGNDYLRIFIKECNIAKDYNLIVFVNNLMQINSEKKIILDEANCNVKIYSNVDVFDLLGVNLNITKFGETTETNVDYREEIIKKHLGKIGLRSFNFIKIIPNAREVELRFSSDNSKSDQAANKFYNRLNQQIFLDKHEIVLKNSGNFGSQSSNYSLKFVLLESDLKEYFTEKNLDLSAYLKREMYEHPINNNIDSEYFAITNKECRAIVLDSQIILDGYLLLFNSNLYKFNANSYDSNCFYFDKSTNMYYLTFGFSLNYDTFINSNYFTIKHEIDLGFISNHLEKKKEKAQNDYFNNILLNTIESSYKVSTRSKIIGKKIRKTKKESSNSNFYNYEIQSSIKLKSFDFTVSWSVDTCWLSEALCFNQIEPSFFFNYNELPEDDFYYDGENLDQFENPSRRNLYQYDFDYGSKDKFNKFKRFVDYDQMTKINKNIIHYVNYTITSFDTKISMNPVHVFYEHEIYLKMKLYDIQNFDNSYKVISCNLKPYASCNGSSTQLYNKNHLRRKNKRDIVELNEIKCQPNSNILKFFEKHDLKKKMKTVMLTKFDPNKPYMLKDRVDYDSSQDKSEIKKKCPISYTNNRNNSEYSITQGPKSTIPTKQTTSVSSFQQKDVYDKSVFFIKQHKLTIILLAITLFFTIFCLIMVKLVFIKPKNQNFSTELQSSNLENSLLSNGNDKPNGQNLNGSLSRYAHNEQELRLLNPESNNLNSTITEESNNQKKCKKKNKTKITFV